VPCLGAQARHAVGCSSGADRGMGAAGVGGVRALPYQGKRADAGVVEGEKGEGGRGCWVGPATEREREPTDRWAWSRKSKFKTDSNLTLSKTGLRGLKKSKIKYSCEVFEEGNNFIHSNFFRFKMNFKLNSGNQMSIK
jgi:hypothetical protein